MPRSPAGAPSSRDRLLVAAAREFAADTYDAIGVDRIARAARLNKAMIYYHFGSKVGLYRALLGQVYDALFASVERAAERGGCPEEKVRAFINAIGETVHRYPEFAAIWLRELTAGARHLDRNTLARGARIVAVLAAMIEEGERLGDFKRTSPLMVQIGAIAPLLMLLVSGTARVRLARAGVAGAAEISFEQMLAHVTEATLGVLRNTEGKRHA